MSQEPELPLVPTVDEVFAAMTIAARLAEAAGATFIARCEVGGMTNTALIGPRTYIFGLAECLAFDVRTQVHLTRETKVSDHA